MMLPDTNIHMKYITKEAAIENVKKMFSNTSEDLISIQDVYKTWERDPEQEVRNKGWFSNKMVDLKYHNLIKPIYGMRNNRRVLTKIQLTMDGKKALGRVGAEEEANEAILPSIESQGSPLSIADAMKIIAQLKKENPEFEITFDIKLRDL